MNDCDGAFIRHPDLQRLFRYWLGLSIDGQVPLRRDIDPLAVRDLMPNLQLLDVGATPDDLRYRLVGGEIATAFGFEPRGKTRREIREAYVSPDKYDDFDQTSRETHDVARRGVVAYTHDYMTSYDHDFLAYARLLLPLSEEGLAITGIFGALMMSSSTRGFWHGFQPLQVEVPITKFGLRAAVTPD